LLQYLLTKIENKMSVVLCRELFCEELTVKNRRISLVHVRWIIVS
jgi:hypothetical protein